MRGVSQRALGAALGMTKKIGSTRINRYEQQTSRADMDTAAALAAALNVPLAYLFADSEELASWILAFGALDPATRADIIARAEALPKP
jgi:transcriptional regulator with XRE-family HTH domain